MLACGFAVAALAEISESDHLSDTVDLYHPVSQATNYTQSCRNFVAVALLHRHAVTAPTSVVVMAHPQCRQGPVGRMHAVVSPAFVYSLCRSVSLPLRITTVFLR